jgi:hypothetical protein
MESIYQKWPYRLIVSGTIIECQEVDEAVALAKLLQPTEPGNDLEKGDAATQN